MLKHSEIPGVLIPQYDKGRGTHLGEEFWKRHMLMTKIVSLNWNDEI